MLLGLNISPLSSYIQQPGFRFLPYVRPGVCGYIAEDQMNFLSQRARKLQSL